VDTTPVSLLKRLRETPDERSWQRLHDLYAPFIRHWLKQNRVSPTEADDLSQEVMLAVLALATVLLGDVRVRLGQFDTARAGLRRALEIREQLAVRFPDDEDNQAELYLREAVAIRQRLAERHADEVGYVAAAGEGQINLGLIHALADTQDDAEQAYRDAERGLTRASDKRPREFSLSISLATLYLNWSNLAQARGDLAAAAEMCTRGIDRLAELLKFEPNLREAGDRMYSLYWARAKYYAEAQEFARAATDWKQAEAFAQSAPWRILCRHERVQMDVRSGQYAMAVGDARNLLDLEPTPPQRYNLACVFALAASAAAHDAALSETERLKVSDDLAGEAMQILAGLASTNFFLDATDREMLADDADLAAIRSRPEFQKLLQP